MDNQTEITLDNLTSALKAVYGQKAEPVLVVFRHWVKNTYDVAKATPELLRQVEAYYLEKYHAAKPSELAEPLDLLAGYGQHFFKTGSSEQRSAFPIALGYT